MFSPEDFSNQSDVPAQESQIELTPEELKALEERYSVGGKSKAAIGAMAVSAALAGALPNESLAQQAPTSERQVQPESAERSVMRSGTVTHPELGVLTVEVYRKNVDIGSPSFSGSVHGVRINGVEMTVASSRFGRNGAGVVEFKNAKGDVEKLQYPSPQGVVNGEKSRYIIKNGSESLVIENK
jgi:hypothetical protein